MESCLTDLGKTVVDKLINGAIKELRFLCCYTCIAEDFEKEKKWLIAEKKTVEQRVEVAKKRGEDIQSNATFFEGQADELIQEDTKAKHACLFGLCPNCIWRYRRGKELTKKTEDIRNLMNKAENLINVGLSSLVPGVERYSSKDYISFEGRESKWKKLLDALTDDNNYIIGLQGMGGNGKTTLAKEVGKELKQSQHFDKVIVTTVSFIPDIKKIQDDIAGPLGLKWDECTDSERPGKLWNRLTNGEKILLILDDMWGHLNFDEIAIPYNHKGCKVLLTTRELWVCNQMGCETIIHLDVLSNADAWILFEKHVGISNSSSKSLLQKGHKIVDACGGLPVAIKIIASSLKGQRDLEEWKAALNSLRNPMRVQGVDEKLDAIYKTLKHSYDNMKNEKAKGLFLLCSVFQEDEQLSIEILTRFGIGVGLFEEFDDKYNDARREVVVAKNKLIDSCLLLEDEDGSMRLHDLVRDVAQWIANGWIQAVNMSNNNSRKSLVERGKNTRYLLYQGTGMNLFSMDLDGSKLEILIVSTDGTDSLEIPISFFQNMTRLRVFHLLNNSWGTQSAKFLPQSIQSLINIRSLLLENFELGDISIIENLQSLETLDLVCCTIVELPHIIVELVKLRLLKLDRCGFGSNPFEVIERCSSLEELYVIDNNGFEADRVAVHQKSILPALQRYYLGYGCKINYSTSSKCVFFPKIDDFVSEVTFKYLVQTAEVLRLQQIGGWRNLMPEIVPIDKGMNDLNELHLSYCPQLQCLIDTNSSEHNVFAKLVALEFLEMENLKELCNGPLPFDFLKCLERLIINDCIHLRSILFKSKLNLCNLKTIKLWYCQELVSVFQLSTSRSLKLLEELDIGHCEKLKHLIIDDDGEEIFDVDVDIDKDNKSHSSMFPNMKTLTIRRCHQLEVILPFHSVQDVPVLQCIEIAECDELKYIFGQCYHKHGNRDLQQEVNDVLLDSLKEMVLSYLSNFINIFPECDHPMCLSVMRSSSKDGSQAQIQLDPIKCNIFPWKYRHKLRSTTSTKIPFDQPQDCSISSASNSHRLHLWKPAQCLSKQSNILCNITSIKLYNVTKIKSVFILPIAPTMFLETLRIVECDELKHIITGNEDSGGNNEKDVLPKLKELYVRDCGQLEYIFGNYFHDHQNNNIHLHLPVLKCLNLRNLSNFISMCPKNYRTTLPTLTEFELKECANCTTKSIGHFINHLDSRHVKDLSGNMKDFFTLEKLQVFNSRVENIFCLDEMTGQQINLGLQKIRLSNLSQMMYLFVGLKNSFTLQNLVKIKIVRCEKLEVIFSTSILRCLPQLHNLIIQECKELKQIIEEEVEDKKMSNIHSPKTCFPQLEVLAIEDCNKLKCVFPTSIRNELPKLNFLIIKEAYELKEVFGGEGDQKVEIPNLTFVAFLELPSLCQGIQFQTVDDRLVINCPQLSLTSTLTRDRSQLYNFLDEEFEMNGLLVNLYDMCVRMTNIQDTSYENSIAETTEDFPGWLEVQATSGREFTSSQTSTNQSLKAKPVEYKQHENGIESIELIFVETKTEQTPEAELEFVENIPSLEIPSIAILSPTNSEVMSGSCSSPLDIPLRETHSQELLDQQSMGERCVMDQQQPLGEIDVAFKVPQSNNYLDETEDQNIEEGSLSQNVVKSTLSIDSETRNVPLIPLLAPLQKGIKRNVEEGTASANTKTLTSSTHSESEDGDSQKTIPFSTINTEPLTTKDSDVGESQETNETHAPGNYSQPMKDFALIASELGQLVSKKYLASENLSLLTDFLVKHPSVRLTNNSFSNRFKGFAYNCLAELLKFLQTHSVLDVLGSSHSDFIELLQDTRRFSFDKDWLDDVERRALFPGLQVSQDALQKLLDSKHSLIQHAEDLKHQVLESIIQQEAQVLEVRVALSAPLGY